LCAVLVGGCGGGDELFEDLFDVVWDSAFEPESRAPTLFISEPTRERSYQTTAESVRIGGTTSDPDADMWWSNSAGGEGDAIPEDDWCFAFCNYDWSATVPLSVGYNFITVVAIGEGGTSQATLEIWRVAVPAQWSWTR